MLGKPKKCQLFFCLGKIGKSVEGDVREVRAVNSKACSWLLLSEPWPVGRSGGVKDIEGSIKGKVNFPQLSCWIRGAAVKMHGHTDRGFDGHS